MSDTAIPHELALPGLREDNPRDFLAALGLVRIVDLLWPGSEPKLSWARDSGMPHLFLVDTVIQTKFVYEEYDIDDGLVLARSELKDKEGNELSSEETRDHVLEALKDGRFVKQPEKVSNAVRVFYKEADEERHHVDFPVYRRFEDPQGVTVRELASGEGWVLSDPTQVNRWFLDEIEERSRLRDGRGTQMRRLIQLLKRFCRSRDNWDLPNGMKLTMLVAECQPDYSTRIDTAFRNLLERIENRLVWDKTIRNLAHPDRPLLTRSSSDDNVVELKSRVSEAIEKLRELDREECQNRAFARKAWDWIFRSDGFFLEFDTKLEEEEKSKRLQDRASLLKSGAARTSGTGVIGTTGVQNLPHRFYGDHG
jgi:hypothetical protein